MTLAIDKYYPMLENVKVMDNSASFSPHFYAFPQFKSQFQIIIIVPHNTKNHNFTKALALDANKIR